MYLDFCTRSPRRSSIFTVPLLSHVRSLRQRRNVRLHPLDVGVGGQTGQTADTHSAISPGSFLRQAPGGEGVITRAFELAGDPGNLSIQMRARVRANRLDSSPCNNVDGCKPTTGVGPSHRIANVKVIMQVAGPARPDDAVVRVIGRMFRRERTKRPAHLHARDDEVHPVPVLTLHTLQMRPDETPPCFRPSPDSASESYDCERSPPPMPGIRGCAWRAPAGCSDISHARRGRNTRCVRSDSAAAGIPG